MANEIDIEQSTQIAALEKDVELLREEVDKYKDKEHEQFNNRISKLEKFNYGIMNCHIILTKEANIESAEIIWVDSALWSCGGPYTSNAILHLMEKK